MKWIGSTLAFATALGAANAAHGHGDGARAKQPGTAAVAKEQKPWGIAGDAAAVARTFRISMHDRMRFTPDLVDVREGETVRFVVNNSGKATHEFVIGTRQENDEHAARMVKFPDMEHDEPYMVHVAPGRVGEIVWTFNRPGSFEFACLIAGHYQAGMIGRIRVRDSAATRRSGRRVG
jgi:uncharacterized cupredoxin-like copper-binding protein